MAATPNPADPERLLVHDAFMRGLARQLIRDPDRAEEAVQETWLAAMRRGPTASEDGTVRAFLSTVLRRVVSRHARAERREAARRLATVRDDVMSSPVEILQREAQRAEVVRLVLALEPAQREAVVLRFFDYLPPRTIARRVGVPVGTVHTRLKRALANLRARLDGRPGGRSAWVGLLAPFADGPVRPSLPLAGWALASGGMGMSAQKVLAVGIVVAVVTLMWVTLAPTWGPSPRAPAPRDAAVAAVAADAGATGDAGVASRAATNEETIARERRAPVSPAPADTGALVVSVVFESDGAPAADVVVEVYRGEEDLPFARPRSRTDAGGQARFDGLRSGRVQATLHRGSTEWGDTVEVVAGATAEAKLTVAIGMDVRGVVVDAHARPVAGAEIVVADWGGGEAILLTRTAADGTFAARAVATHCHIGARAAGFAASLLRQFTAGKGASVDLRIVLDTPAVEVHGVVLDPQGAAVAGAIVRAGNSQQESHQLTDGARAMGRRPELTLTNARGEFRLWHLPAGKVPIAVRAPSWSPWAQEIDLVPGPPLRLVVTLTAGVTLRGTVTDAAGAPVRAEVQVGDWDDLGHQCERCGPDGSYRFEGLAAGTLRVVAESDQHGKASAQLPASPGQALTWNPRLEGGLEVMGSVVGPDNKPIARVTIEAQLEGWGQGEHWWGLANSDDDGRFRLKNCPAGRTVRLQVRRRSTFPEVTLTGIATGSTDVVVRLPKEAWIHITGTILDPDGNPLPNVAVSPSLTGGTSSPAETADPATGRVRLGPYPPGTYWLRLDAAGFPQIELTREVKPDEELDFGELRFERGGAFVCSPVGDSDLLVGVRGTVHEVATARSVELEWREGNGRCGPLRPGEYRLLIASKAAAPATIAFSIRASRDTRLDVPLQRGVAVELVAMASSAADGTLVSFVVHDADKQCVGDSTAESSRGTARASIALAPGDYRLGASTAELAGSTSFTVPAQRRHRAGDRQSAHSLIAAWVTRACEGDERSLPARRGPARSAVPSPRKTPVRVATVLQLEWRSSFSARNLVASSATRPAFSEPVRVSDAATGPCSSR